MIVMAGDEDNDIDVHISIGPNLKYVIVFSILAALLALGIGIDPLSSILP